MDTSYRICYYTSCSYRNPSTHAGVYALAVGRSPTSVQAISTLYELSRSVLDLPDYRLRSLRV
jgi:hypothetical protein